MTADTPRFLPYGRQWIEADDIAAVAEVLRSDWLTTGPAVTEFENELAARVGACHAVVCANGTAALHLAALALNIQPGDHVIVPAMTFLATANAIRFVGGEVVFADVDPQTGLMGPEHLLAACQRAAGKPLKAVFPVHLNGQCVAMDQLAPIASEQGLQVVEDACHALGSTYPDPHGRSVPAGSCQLSDMTVFSFHPVKTIAMGEGGAITCNQEHLRDRLRRLRSHGMHQNPREFAHPELALASDGTANPWYYEMPEPGFNYRISDINCALGRSQLRKLDRFAARRSDLAARYDRLLAPLAPRIRPIARQPGQTPVWHLYAVHIDFDQVSLERAALMHALRARGIGTQVHYLPVSDQPYYRQRYGDLDLPGARSYYRRVLSLPLFPSMLDTDVERVVEALTQLLA
ncbi:MAG: UDP-4-amino-4,6-dideoxy-N-acetyl-beta-L-altrosamine transaminase [Magnetococcales bacterium]|nr:UDP-4-amino-4,6-dideoxy-N-acetyl-beta-L-altrosamine transaminase [Magnetococcales bacterium]